MIYVWNDCIVFFLFMFVDSLIDNFIKFLILPIKSNIIEMVVEVDQIPVLFCF